MFDFQSGNDKATYNSFKNLIETNQGLFKSGKQADFLFKTFKAFHQNCKWTVETIKDNFGIDIKETEVLVPVYAMTRWADYGRRSFRPVTWMYVVDKAGVSKQFKLGYVGDMVSGTHPDPKKTERIWERSVEVSVPEEAPKQPNQESKSDFFGVPGHKVEFKGTIISVREFKKSTRYHYYDDGIGYITKIAKGDDIIIYWGKLKAEVGDEVTIVARIKDHDVRDGVKQTIISYPKLK